MIFADVLFPDEGSSLDVCELIVEIEGSVGVVVVFNGGIGGSLNGFGRSVEKEGELDIHGLKTSVIDEDFVLGVVFYELNKLTRTVSPGFSSFFREEDERGAPEEE